MKEKLLVLLTVSALLLTACQGAVESPVSSEGSSAPAESTSSAPAESTSAPDEAPAASRSEAASVPPASSAAPSVAPQSVPVTLSGKKVEQLYIMDYPDRVYYPVEKDRWSDIVRELEGFPRSALGEDFPGASELGYLFWMEDGSREAYYVTPDWVCTDSHFLSMSREERELLTEFTAEEREGLRVGYPQWLTYMDSNNLVRVEATAAYPDAKGRPGRLRTGDEKTPSKMLPIAEAVRAIRCDGPGRLLEQMPEPSEDSESIRVKLVFRSGVVYRIDIRGEKLTLSSSDRDGAIEYTLYDLTEAEALRGALKPLLLNQ